MPAMKNLHVALVAPSRYDQDGVAVYRRGMSPNGALGAVAGLIEDYNRRHRGRSHVTYEFFDEHVRHPVEAATLRSWARKAATTGSQFVLMLCGIQTATYPRARDIGLMARGAGMVVLAGGVHLSAHGPSVAFLQSCGISVALGEVEPIFDRIIDDSLQQRLQPLYRLEPSDGVRVKSATSYITAPDITDAPFPHIPSDLRRHYINPRHMFVDSSRGCPFLCSFCVVKNVFGRVVRSREPKTLVNWMMQRVRADGIRAFSFTDDNFARNPRHLELLQALAIEQRRGPRFTLWLILDVEASCYAAEDSVRGERTRAFLELCEAAGVSDVYIGLESTNDAALQEMRKGVNRDREEIHNPAGGGDTTRQRLLQRYRAAIDAWHSIGVSVECGYILGFEADAHGSGGVAAADLIEIGVDGVTFYLRAPLPGSEDYADGFRDGTLLLDDFNEYFTDQPMLAHPTLTPTELRAELKHAVAAFWGWRPLLRRIVRGTLGIGGRRVRRPLNFLKRQVGCKLMLSRGMYTYVEGGLGRHQRGKAPREVISDTDAYRHYLGGDPVVAPQAVRRWQDESRIDSLPILVDAAPPEPESSEWREQRGAA